jgi:GH15 family glucan-1,4-alpha-glucosidase
MDAALLMLPFVGFISADDPKMVGTVAAIQDRLMVDGFVRRYDTASRVDGQPGGEGAFIPCTCWLADCLSLQGHDEQARELFERVLDVRNDVGLLSEEYDVANGRLIGNFPQAFSHVSVIGTARNLSRGMVGPAERRLRRPRRVGRVALRGVRR